MAKQLLSKTLIRQGASVFIPNRRIPDTARILDAVFDQLRASGSQSFYKVQVENSVPQHITGRSNQ